MEKNFEMSIPCNLDSGKEERMIHLFGILTSHKVYEKINIHKTPTRIMAQ